MNRAATPGAGRRLVGLDLFRALAVFGMLVAHVGPAAWDPGAGVGQVHWQWEIFHSRMPAMFAFAAGISLNLGSRAPGAGSALPKVARAVLLSACGFALQALGTPVVVILIYFGVYFLLAIPLQRMQTHTLFIVAGIWAVAGPALSFALRSALEAPGNPLWSGVVAGDYPALTWMPLVIAGMAVGRLKLAHTSIRRRLGGWGAVVTVLVYGSSEAFLAAGGREQIVATLPGTADLQPIQQYARIFFGESGVTDTSSWLWLLTSAPHSGSWGDLWGALGICALLLAVLLPLGDWAAEGSRASSWRGARSLVLFLSASGAMVLSVYAAHIAVMWAVSGVTGYSFGPAQPVWVLIAFTVGMAVLAGWWMGRWSRGPVEWALADVTAAAVRVARREKRGSA